MSFDIQFENRQHGVLVNCSGLLNADDLSSANGQVFSQLNGHALEYEIWDFSNATQLDITVREMRELVHLEMHAVESGKMSAHKVAVVGSPEVVGALARLYAHMCQVWSGHQSQYFTNMHDAREWVSHH